MSEVAGQFDGNHARIVLSELPQDVSRRVSRTIVDVDEAYGNVQRVAHVLESAMKPGHNIGLIENRNDDVKTWPAVIRKFGV